MSSYPLALRKDDGPGTNAGRRRMASAEGQAVYRQRPETMITCMNKLSDPITITVPPLPFC